MEISDINPMIELVLPDSGKILLHQEVTLSALNEYHFHAGKDTKESFLELVESLIEKKFHQLIQKMIFAELLNIALEV